MTPPKVLSIVGARPNFIKLAPIDKVLRKNFEHIIIHTGQHYDFQMSEIFFKEFNIPHPNYNLEIGGNTQGYQVGEMIKKLELTLLSDKYDLVLVYGDTNSTFAGAFIGNRLKFKVGHIESGLRSFDRSMPEEINRILTDNLSDLLFSPTNASVRNLQNENIYGKIMQTGDLSVEIVNEYLKLPSRRRILQDLSLEKKNYILFTMHRAENTSNYESLVSLIKTFEKLKDKEIVFPIHPRTEKAFGEFNLKQKLLSLKNVKVIQPLGFRDFLCLMQNASKVVTDSGGIQKEAYLLSVPCITTRTNTEWVETIEEGWNVLTGLNPDKISNIVNHWVPPKTNKRSIFGNGSTSRSIEKKIREFIS